ncbi:hypothetical protein HD806DRAFT_492745 [Xylariaceae sp. AK1471]|nr:hypothetical protein HD806DRAFT_492745 [Xylariaceae sp. AK1471]
MATTASRRSEGFQSSQQKQTRRAQHQQQQQPQQQFLPPSPVARMKRPLDPIDNLTGPLKAKRTRIAVEIFARPITQALGPPKSILVKRQFPTTQPIPVASAAKPERPSPTTNPLPSVPPPVPLASIPTATTTETTTTETTESSTQLPPHSTTTATSKEHGLTRHQEKVINGIRHELDRLQPNVVDTSSASGPPGRKLRSQEATRFKSELSAYFPEYDEVIGNDPPKEQQLPNVDTPIVIYDTERESSDVVATSSTDAHPHPTHLGSHSSTVQIYNDHLFTDLHNSQIVNFDFLKIEHSSNDLEDALPDSQFAPVHRRAERLEKSIRNTERGRAQHERDQIIRLLGELQGHDWLRTMGVNGVTESRKKSFEPARDHFVKGCQAILNKFRLWSQEEKRRKLERERALAEETDDEEDEDQEEVDGSDSSEEANSLDDVDMVDIQDEGGDDAASGGEPPEYSDVDAAARQLHDEALAQARYAALNSPRKVRGEPPPPILDPTPREFTSFFEKRHQRDAALNKSRRRGRTILAWGHPVPEMSEYDFELPADCLDEDTLKAHERQKRRDRRQRKQ